MDETCLHRALRRRRMAFCYLLLTDPSVFSPLAVHNKSFAEKFFGCLKMIERVHFNRLARALQHADQFLLRSMVNVAALREEPSALVLGI